MNARQDARPSELVLVTRHIDEQGKVFYTALSMHDPETEWTIRWKPGHYAPTCNCRGSYAATGLCEHEAAALWHEIHRESQEDELEHAVQDVEQALHHLDELVVQENERKAARLQRDYPLDQRGVLNKQAGFSLYR